MAQSDAVRSTIDNPDIMEMFHDVLGTGDGGGLNLKIVYPKYKKIEEHCIRFLHLLEALLQHRVMRQFPSAAQHLAGYIESLYTQAAGLFIAPDLETLYPAQGQIMAGGVDFGAVSAETLAEFATVYTAVKDCNLVNTVVVTCNNLGPHRKSLEDKTALRDFFLTKSAGLSFAPIPDLPAVNFKQIYISDQVNPTGRHFLMMVLHKMLTISRDVYEAVSLPDIDVDEFVDVIINSLDDVKKQIPRCNEAFNKIRDSVGLLKGNFGGYYKDYVASSNPTIIMENFVLDVSKSTSSSPKVTMQFRKIIQHYRKLASQQAQNPKMQSLFAHVEKNFDALDAANRADAARGEADADADTDTATAADSAAAASGEAAEGAAASGGAAEGDDGAGAAEPPLSKAERVARVKQMKNKKQRDRKRRQRAERDLETAMETAATSEKTFTQAVETAQAAEPEAAVGVAQVAAAETAAETAMPVLTPTA
jgi:hypothetical protein